MPLAMDQTVVVLYDVEDDAAAAAEAAADFKGVASSCLTLVKRSNDVEIPLQLFSVEDKLNIRVISRKRISTYTFSDEDLFKIKIRPEQKIIYLQKDNDKKLLINDDKDLEDLVYKRSCKIQLSVGQVIKHEFGTFLLKRLGSELYRDNMEDFFKNAPSQASTSPYRCHNENAYCERVKEFCGLANSTTHDSSCYYPVECSECTGTTPPEGAARWPTVTWSLYRVCYTCSKDQQAEKDRLKVFCPKCFYDGKHFDHQWKMLVLMARAADRARLKKVVKLKKDFEVWRERYAPILRDIWLFVGCDIFTVFEEVHKDLCPELIIRFVLFLFIFIQKQPYLSLLYHKIMKHLTLTVSSVVESPQISTNFSHIWFDLPLDQHVIILSLTFSKDDFYHKARVSGLLLCVGIGSYLTYRLCLKIFNCDSLADLLAKLKAALSSRSIKKLRHKNCSTRFSNGGRTSSVAGSRESDGQTFSVSSSSSSSSKIQYYFYKGKKIAKIDSQTLRQKFSNKRKRHSSSLDSIFDQQQQQQLSKNCRNAAAVNSPRHTFCGAYDDNDASTVDQGLNNLNLTRKSVSGPTPICRTNALSDDDCRFSVASSSTSTNSRSPPPIQRNRIKNDQNTQFDDKSSVESTSYVSSSVQQGLIWDNICTPCSTESKKLFEFDHPLALQNDLFDRTLLNDSLTVQDDPESDPDLLIRKLLDSLTYADAKIDLSPDARADSPEPSEWSEVSSYAANVEIGNETIGHFTLAENILVDTRRDFDHFATDFARSFDQRRLDWLSSVDYSRRMYCSVTVQCQSTTNSSHNASPQRENCTSSEVPQLGEYSTIYANVTDGRLSASSRGEKRRYARSLPCDDHKPINGKRRKRRSSISRNALENEEIIGNLRSCSRLSNDSKASDYWSYYSSSNENMSRHSGCFKCCEVCRHTRSTSFPLYVIKKFDRSSTTDKKHNKRHFSDFNIADETSHSERKNFFTQSKKRDESGMIPKERASLHLMTMSSSFEDSCLSSMSNSKTDQSASTSSCEKVGGVCNNNHQWWAAASGHKFEPSLDITPEDKDYENEGSCYSRASSVRPDSLLWDEFDPDETMKSVHDDLNNNEEYGSSSQYNFLPIPRVPGTPSTSRVVNLLDFVKELYPTCHASHETLRKLARHDGLFHVRRPSNDKESLIESFLFHAQRSNIDLFDRCSFLNMKERLQTFFARHKSVFINLGRDYNDFDRLSRALEVLWNFQNNNRMMTSHIFPTFSEDFRISEADDGDLVKAIQILLVLRILETHDRRFLRDDNGNVFTNDYFYNELFNNYTLTNLGSLICGNSAKDEKFTEFLFALLADTFHLMVNVFRFTVDGHIFNDNYHSRLSSNTIDRKMEILNFGRFETENSSTELFLSIF